MLRTYRRAAGCDGKHHVSAFSNLLQQFVQVFQICLGRSASQLFNSMVLMSILVLVTSIVVVLTSTFMVDEHSAGFSQDFRGFDEHFSSYKPYPCPLLCGVPEHRKSTAEET